MASAATKIKFGAPRIGLSVIHPIHDLELARNYVREGRFQRSLSLVAGCASLISGLEVSYEHYKGSYGQRIMYSPVILSGMLFGAGVWGFFSGKAARTLLRAVSAITLIDCAIGFIFTCVGSRGNLEVGSCHSRIS